MIEVPLLDLKAQYAGLRDELEPVVKEVIESQWFIGGPNVTQLEEDIAEYCTTSRAVGCASGSDAIQLALQAADVNPGDIVVCPTYTFFSTAGSISRIGAIPLLVDVDPATYNMDPKSLDVALSKAPQGRVKAIMPVHLFGQCCDMDSIMGLAADQGISVIEDAAQALGSEDVHGRRAGSMSVAGCFSFFPSKNLGGFGDGGVMTFQDPEMASRAARLRNHGMEPKYYHHEVGCNSRLDALQAAVLRVKMRHLDSWTEGRRENARFYDDCICEAGGLSSDVSLGETSKLPIRYPLPASGASRHIYNQYIIRVPAGHRDMIRARLSEARIGTEVYYPLALHQQECYRDLDLFELNLSAAERASRETIAIPIYPDLTQAQKEHVMDTLLSIVSSL
ncbi:MAG: transcriptional regulator [Planctomycetaceae bacterium]|nr:transcriptional regulator [Planctomycetaceae bacterium]